MISGGSLSAGRATVKVHTSLYYWCFCLVFFDHPLMLICHALVVIYDVHRLRECFLDLFRQFDFHFEIPLADHLRISCLCSLKEWDDFCFLDMYHFSASFGFGGSTSPNVMSAILYPRTWCVNGDTLTGGGMSGSGFGFMRSRSTAAITSFSFFRSASMDGGKFTSPASLFSSSMSAGPLSVCVCLLHFIFPQLFMIVNWTLSASFMRICPSFIAIFIVGYFLSV